MNSFIQIFEYKKIQESRLNDFNGVHLCGDIMKNSWIKKMPVFEVHSSIQLQ